MIIRVDRQVTLDMLRRTAAAYGMTLREVTELWRTNQLWEPNLRDLWLIWAREIQDSDLDGPTPG